ncbi:MAG TPA: hypothetical protein VLW85_14930 [Myxococcales bacterium]|nr:hypothetical protein [Myxococcales bacterium]
MKPLFASFAGLIAFAGIFFAPGRSLAGLDYGPLPQTGYCYRYPDSSGGCGGTFTGFRLDSDPNTYAQVSTSTWGNGRYFYASYRGIYVGCAVSPYASQDLKNQIEKLPLFKGQFWISFDSSGYCTDIELSQASYYQQ